MKQFNPFPVVPGWYDAPVGRQGSNPANLEGVRRLHARHQGGRAGYDKGGAYWGRPSNVWGVWGWVGQGVFCVYVRADSRKAAIGGVRQGDIREARGLKGILRIQEEGNRTLTGDYEND